MPCSKKIVQVIKIIIFVLWFQLDSIILDHLEINANSLRACLAKFVVTLSSLLSIQMQMQVTLLWKVEYPVMSGGKTIAVTTVLLETGMLPMQEPVTELTLEAPAGLIRVKAECSNGKVTNVTYKNVPAFAPYIDAEIDVPHLGKVKVDVGWGGMLFQHRRYLGIRRFLKATSLL